MNYTLMVLGDLPEGTDISPFREHCGPEHATADAIAVFEPDLAAADLSRILMHIGKPLAPVADFTGTDGFRRDIQGSSQSVAAIAAAFAELHYLVERCEKFTDLPLNKDRHALTCLGIAHTRQKPIQPTWHPQTPQALWYPSAGSSRGTLEDLANAGLLNRRFAYRLHVCDACQSHRLQVYEACTECGSGFLDEESVVHHFACGEQGPESQFLNGHDLICPKCSKELRHFGVDYARPGQLLLCKSCNASMSEPDAHFVCMDCDAKSPASRLETVDWFAYDISDDGVEALLRRRLPAVTFDDLLAPHERAFSRREFSLLAIAMARQATRYERPLTVVRVNLKNKDSLVKEVGVAAADEAIGLVIDLLVEHLRETDFFTNTGESELLVFLPETDADQARHVFTRFSERVADAVIGKLEIATAFIDSENIMRAIEEVG